MTFATIAWHKMSLLRNLDTLTLLKNRARVSFLQSIFQFSRRTGNLYFQGGKNEKNEK